MTDRDHDRTMEVLELMKAVRAAAHESPEFKQAKLLCRDLGMLPLLTAGVAFPEGDEIKTW
jgi:hypothetical protein